MTAWPCWPAHGRKCSRRRPVRARSSWRSAGCCSAPAGSPAVSAAFAVHMALGVWWPFALLVGLGWGVVIVNLDRMVLVGMGHDSSLGRNMVLAVPRVGLALVLGVVVATPLTLQVFHKEIDTEIVRCRPSGGRVPGLAGVRRPVRRAAGAAGAGRDRGVDRGHRRAGRRRSRGGAGRGDGAQAALDAALAIPSWRRRRSASSTAPAAPGSRGPGARTRPRGRRPTRRRRSWRRLRSDVDDASMPPRRPRRAAPSGRPTWTTTRRRWRG